MMPLGRQIRFSSWSSSRPRETQVDQVEHDLLLVEQSHDDALALGRRDRRHTNVDHLAGDLLGDASVLRQALLRDVEASLDLHAAHDRRQEAAIGFLARDESPVDTIAHDDLVVGWLDVDVGRPLLDRGVEQVVDPANDRRLIGHVDQVAELLDLFAFFRLGESGFVLALVDAVDRVVDGLFGGGDRDDRLAQKDPEIVDGKRVEWVGDGDAHRFRRLSQGKDTVLTSEVDRDRVDELFRNRRPSRSSRRTPFRPRRPSARTTLSSSTVWVATRKSRQIDRAVRRRFERVLEPVRLERSTPDQDLSNVALLEAHSSGLPPSCLAVGSWEASRRLPSARLDGLVRTVGLRVLRARLAAPGSIGVRLGPVRTLIDCGWWRAAPSCSRLPSAGRLGSVGLDDSAVDSIPSGPITNVSSLDSGSQRYAPIGARGRGRAEARALRPAPADLFFHAVDLVDDLRNQTPRSGVVDVRLELVFAEHEVPVDHLLTLLHLALEDLSQVARVADDVRRENEQQVRLALGLARLAEQSAQDRDVAEDRNLVFLVLNRVAHQTADDDRLLVAHHDLGSRGAAVDRDHAQGAGRRALLGDLLFDLEADLVVRVDVWRDSNGGADVLASDAAEAASQASQVAEILPALRRGANAPRLPRPRTCRGQRRWSAAGCSRRR